MTSSIGQTIFNGIWKIILALFGQIANAFGNLFQDAFSGLGQSIVAMFQTFGFSLSPYGVWAPLMFVVDGKSKVAVPLTEPKGTGPEEPVI